MGGRAAAKKKGTDGNANYKRRTKTEAESKEEARSYFMSEYWDIKEIISIHK